MGRRTDRNGLSVDAGLCRFIEQEALPGTGVTADEFWVGLADIATALTSRNKALLARREELQSQIDARHLRGRGAAHDPAAYESFLREIGYIVPEESDFAIETRGTDPEIATLCGPQLVVPVTNARYALNAANARWGSLYDALYGTDALGTKAPEGGFDRERGAAVVAWVKAHLDKVVPLAGARWPDVTSLAISGNALVIETGRGEAKLADPARFVGHQARADDHLWIVLQANGLKIVLVIDRTNPVGAADPAGIADVLVEGAISAIIDFEDSVATVDAEDKVAAYANWLGLMKGDLTANVTKGGRTFTRRLEPDWDMVLSDGQSARVKRRALLLVRNVGHLMTNPAILLPDGSEMFEGLIDAMVTTLCAMHDLRKSDNDRFKNSREQSVYVVKPKMHGPEEVAFADEIFSRVEAALGLPEYTVKLGIMDEERRTSVNLKECIRAARHRVAFINTGFLDRTGDEIHTSMEAGPMIRKGDMKNAAWIASYEDRNVDIGLACGLRGKAQIGKGMWAMPDLMHDMLDQKIGHPRAGANCAWVPSPTAAALHATHYHLIDVAARQDEIAAGAARGTLADLLTIPLATGQNWSDSEITAEIENNAQGILGYVVRWIDQGVGCSKVPDIRDVGLMEDRATCRISSQALANWLHHGVVSKAQVTEAMQKMAAKVDAQNAGDPAYRPMAPGFDGVAFRAACDLVFLGRQQPSGYTEPVLHARRIEAKARG